MVRDGREAQASSGGDLTFPVPDAATLVRMALYFDMRQKAQSGLRTLDERADASFLDHPGLNRWLDEVRQQHGIQNTGYTIKR